MSILVADIKFYKVDEDGNAVLNKEGTHIQLYELKRNRRFKALEYLTDDMDDDLLVEVEQGTKRRNKRLLKFNPRKMNVKELKKILSKQDNNNEVIFFNLKNNNLTQFNLESIIDADERCEITTTENEH